MIQAWLALPALAAAYLLAAPAARLRTRCAHAALAGLVTAVVSLSWMTAVPLVPSQHRPYVDGSRDDSVYTRSSTTTAWAGSPGTGRAWPGRRHLLWSRPNRTGSC
jgi:4-amino-4-deoxy-L-arabinose transferase-like glycosyltransferase